jgi:hypothetical protein
MPHRCHFEGGSERCAKDMQPETLPFSQWQVLEQLRGLALA